jgi:hypothetical protein
LEDDRGDVPLLSIFYKIGHDAELARVKKAKPRDLISKLKGTKKLPSTRRLSARVLSGVRDGQHTGLQQRVTRSFW